MHTIKADSSKNLLILKLEGYMNDQEVHEAAEQVVSEAKKLAPGFSVINDISKMKPASQKGVEDITKAQAAVVQLGVSKVIRIVNNPVSKMQFQRTARIANANYQVAEVSNMDEAMQMI